MKLSRQESQSNFQTSNKDKLQDVSYFTKSLKIDFQETELNFPNRKWYYCQAQPKSQPANPQLGAEIALFSQLWGTTLHPMGPEQRIHALFMTSL